CNQDHDHILEHLLKAYRQARSDTRFQQIAVLLIPRLFRIAFRELWNEAAANDIVQEVLIRVKEKLPKTRTDENLVGWVHRVARNLVMDRFRDRLKSNTLD